jgi:hypothetical protein
MLGTDRGQEKTMYVKLTVPCTTTINVTQTGVDVPDAYVCKNTKVTWKAPDDLIFHVIFKHDCPFTSGCRQIDNQHPTAGPLIELPTSTLTVFDYGITVNGKLFDPHIIGGGG